MDWMLLLKCDLGFGAEFLVVAITNDQPNSLRTASEVERVVSVSGHGKPEITLHLFPQRREMREQILVLSRLDLRHSYALATDDRVVFFRYPQHAVEYPLALQHLPWT